MRLRHIEVFNAIYTVGSVSGAAKILNITQPTVSKILKHAEDQLGFKLFKRIRGRLVPTDEAEVVYRETKTINDQVASLQKIVNNLLKGDSGQLKLAAIAALGLECIPKAVLEFRRRHPNAKFEIQTCHHDHLHATILEQDKDIGIAFNPQKQRGLEEVLLGTGEFVCIYAGDEFDDYPDRIKISDIGNRPCIGIENSGPLGDLLNSLINESNTESVTDIVAQTYFVALNLVAMGGGVAIVDEFTARSSGIAKVKYKALDPPLEFMVKAIYKDSKPLSKLGMHFLDFFKKEILDKREPLY
ncbi:LysR family transcriptional regulator [Exilibacterium tricleocarpae]|uniref:LysR family transcriptional regulator n=1 Tax=Exilibacterium tricleocarpae TaxID=2591008 RepID=A0A545SQJ9_9GAMM|nr:LysR family transcriptional regulator [Exilibacterium tricleocarpae]TQV67244.1 LysR family transcriptional regulator [Exilibacterium tricleocarpae]